MKIKKEKSMSCVRFYALIKFNYSKTSEIEAVCRFMKMIDWFVVRYNLEDYKEFEISCGWGGCDYRENRKSMLIQFCKNN